MSSLEERHTGVLAGTPFERSPILARLPETQGLAVKFSRTSRTAGPDDGAGSTRDSETGDRGHWRRWSISGPIAGPKSAPGSVYGPDDVEGQGGETTEMLLQPLMRARTTPAPALEDKLQFAYNISWVVNVALFIAKGYAYYISHSKSVLASLVDSFVDLVSQLVIFYSEYQSKRADPKFPVGKARLETIGVLACATIMSVAAYAVIQDSGMALFDGFANEILPDLDASILMYAVLGSATGLKLICYVLCVALQNKSDSMLALAEDHLNDIMSNVTAAGTAALASYVPNGWWMDPLGGILISLFILWRWMDIAKAQLDKIVGRGAPEEMLNSLAEIVNAHDENLTMDCLRAYHFGARFMVEAEVIMPIHFTLKQVHDISLSLQHKIEAIPEIERAFVHVDYEMRLEPEHRADRLLAGLPMVVEEQPSLLCPQSPT